MAEYLDEFEASDEVLGKVYELNKKYNKQIEENEEVYRNVNWSLKNMEWDNVFNYGEGNSIDFTKLQGIVGIFGKNYSGKSSIVDTLLYTMYNKTSKSIKKSYNIINQNKESCNSRVQIEVDGKNYFIERSSKKDIKKRTGEDLQTATTDLEFYSEDEVGQSTGLNGTSRQDTDSNVRKYFGTINDFLLTSMASQLDSLSFINEGSTKRKEYLAKFLDLEIFDKKFKMAKEESALTRASLKKLEGVDFDEQISSIKKEITKSELAIESHKAECRVMRSDLQEMNLELKQLSNKIDSVPAEIIDPVLTQQEISRKERLILETSGNRTRTIAQLEQDENKFENIADFLETFNVDSYKEKLALIEKKKSRLAELIKEMGVLCDEKLRNVKKQDLLSEVPCGDKYPSCRFIKDAHQAGELVQITQASMTKNAVETNTLGAEISSMEPKKIEDHMQKYELLLNKKANLATSIASAKLTIERADSLIFREQVELDELKNKNKEYIENKEAIENLKQLLKELKKHQQDIRNQERSIEECDAKVMRLHQRHGSLDEKLKSTKERLKEKKAARARLCCIPSTDDVLSPKWCLLRDH